MRCEREVECKRGGLGDGVKESGNCAPDSGDCPKHCRNRDVVHLLIAITK